MTLGLGGLLSSRAQSSLYGRNGGTQAAEGEKEPRANVQIISSLPVPQGIENSPMLALPKNLPDLVDEEGGGGFWI